MSNLIIQGAGGAPVVGNRIQANNFATSTVDATGGNLTVPGNLVVQTKTNLGAVGNITLTGGTSGAFLQTNGAGGLSWTTTTILAPAASAPTTRADGSALVTGDMYYNTANKQLYAWDGTTWASQSNPGWLGAADTVSAPTTRENGTALQHGDVFFNTTTNSLNYWSGTAWVAPSAGATVSLAYFFAGF